MGTYWENDSEVFSIENRGFPAHSHLLSQLIFIHALAAALPHSRSSKFCELLIPSELTTSRLLEDPMKWCMQRVKHNSRPIISYYHSGWMKSNPHIAYTLGETHRIYFMLQVHLLLTKCCSIELSGSGKRWVYWCLAWRWCQRVSHTVVLFFENMVDKRWFQGLVNQS